MLLAFAAIAACFEVHNLDLPLHARTGEWIVEHGEVPTTNVLSHIHQHHPMVADKWLFQVLAHVLHDGLGLDAVLVARLVLVVALAALMGLLARARGAGPAALLTLCVLGLVATRARLFFRPDLVSLVFVGLVAWALLVPGRHRVPWWLIALQVVWVNVHGYFTLGPLVVAAVSVGHLFGSSDDRRRARSLALLAVALVGACFVNPSGWRGAHHPIGILSDLSAHYDFYTSSIIEFLPTFREDPRGPYDRLAFFVLLPLSGAVLIADVVRRPRSADAWSALFVALGLGALTLSLRRNMSPFAVVVAPLAAAATTRMLGAAAARRRVRLVGTAAALGLTALVTYGEVSDHISIHDGLDRRWGWGRSAIAYPDGAIDFIAEHLGDRETVFTSFSFGSAFTGARYPAQAAATDGNTHGYTTAYLQDVMAAVSQQRPEAFGEIVERYDLSVALLGAATPLSVALFVDRDWTLVFLGRRDAVFVRNDSVPTAWLGDHSLELVLARGELPARGSTPPRRSLFGLPVAYEPLVEVAQAVLFAGGGHVDAARRVLDDALRVAPDDGRTLAFAGLLAARVGDTDRARELLRRADAAPGYHSLRGAVSEALERLAE